MNVSLARATHYKRKKAAPLEIAPCGGRPVRRDSRALRRPSRGSARARVRHCGTTPNVERVRRYRRDMSVVVVVCGGAAPHCGNLAGGRPRRKSRRRPRLGIPASCRTSPTDGLLTVATGDDDLAIDTRLRARWRADNPVKSDSSRRGGLRERS
jgi:hypothetical protein